MASNKYADDCRYWLWRSYWVMHGRLIGRNKKVAPLDKALLGAVETNNVHNAKIFLERGANANGFFYARQSLLIKAVVLGNTEIARLLLEAGAEVDAFDPMWKATPLMYAAIKGQPDTSTLLLDHGANLSRRCYKGQDAFHYAAYHNHPETLKVLLKVAIERNHKPLKGHALMIYAQDRKHDEIVELLEQLGIPKRPTYSRPTPTPPVEIEVSLAKQSGGRHLSRPLQRNRVLKASIVRRQTSETTAWQNKLPKKTKRN